MNLTVKSLVASVLGVIAGLASVVFLLMPIYTVTELILCGGSLVIAIICGAIAE